MAQPSQWLRPDLHTPNIAHRPQAYQQAQQAQVHQPYAQAYPQVPIEAFQARARPPAAIDTITHTQSVPWRQQSGVPMVVGRDPYPSPHFPSDKPRLVEDVRPRDQLAITDIAHSLTAGQTLPLLDEREKGYLELIHIVVDNDATLFRWIKDSKFYSFTPLRLRFLGIGRQISGGWRIEVDVALGTPRFGVVYNPFEPEIYHSNLKLEVQAPPGAPVNIISYIHRRYVVEDYLEGTGGF